MLGSLSNLLDAAREYGPVDPRFRGRFLTCQAACLATTPFRILERWWCHRRSTGKLERALGLHNIEMIRHPRAFGYAHARRSQTSPPGVTP
jgi:hypothetical protein